MSSRLVRIEGSPTRRTISYRQGSAGRHVCVQRLHVSVDAGSGQSSTRVHGPPDRKRIDSALVGVEPPQMMPTMRYSVRPPAVHFSTRTGMAAVSIVAGMKSRDSDAH